MVSNSSIIDIHILPINFVIIGYKYCKKCYKKANFNFFIYISSPNNII